GRGLVAEINPRIEMRENAAQVDGDHDVRRLRRAVRPRHLPRLDGLDREAAIKVGLDAAKTLERGIGGAAVARMGVAALGVGLPGLEQYAIGRLSGRVAHA